MTCTFNFSDTFQNNVRLTMQISRSSMSSFWLLKWVKTSCWCHRRCGKQLQHYARLCLSSLRHYILDWSTSWVVLVHVSLLLIFVNLWPFSQPCSHCLLFRVISYCFAVVEQLIRGKEKYQNWSKFIFLRKYPQRPNSHDHSLSLNLESSYIKMKYITLFKCRMYLAL